MAATRIALLATVLAALVGACGGAARTAVAWPDAPVTLRDDTDREQAIDRLWTLPAGPARDATRARIAEATVRRIADAIEEDRPFAAALLLDQLTWMWQPDPAHVGPGLAPHLEMLKKLRAMFAKSGALEPAVQTLVLLAEVEPAQRAAHLGELDEVLAFADDLAISDNGPNAGRAQPIALLQPTALALPLPWLVDRYVGLLEERQRVVASLIDRQGASMQLVRAHHDILSTGRRIANVLARAGRVTEIQPHLARGKGLGYQDRELAARAEVLADHPSAEAYEALAATLRVDEHAADPAAALVTALSGLAAYPGDPGLLVSAAGDARTIGRIEQPIVLYEAALHGSSEVDTTTALRLGKLYGERLARLASAGRPAAAHTAWREVLVFTGKEAKAHPHTVWQQAAAVAEAALGRGLATQGLLEDARHALAASLERAPSIEAYETLSTVEVQVNRPVIARHWVAAGVAMLGDQGSGDRYRRAKLERLDADALRLEGKAKLAAERYLDSLRTWASLGDDKDLPHTIAAERALDRARVMWHLGEVGPAVELVMSAVDLDAETPATPVAAVALLVEMGRYRDALDAYHRGLGAASIDEASKVYMSLWVAAEAKRLGEPTDRLAQDYLANRQGDAWFELLARAATGRATFAELRRYATTGPRMAQLAFYGAMLGFDPSAATAAGKRGLLEEVLAAGIVFDEEYDLARAYLRQQ